jgi:hypothetical protein
MERQLFYWDGWDDIETGVYQFYKVVLKTKVGSFEPGEKFDAAVVDYQKGILHLYRGDVIVGVFELRLAVL